MIDTLGALRADVIEWLGGENIAQTRIDSAINDAIETLWENLILAVMNIFMGGPVTLALSGGDERKTLVTVADPLGSPPVSFVASGSLPTHSGNVAFTYVTESGSETILGPPAAYTAGANFVVLVGSPAYSAGAFGWNCYATTDQSPTPVYAKQNNEPIPFGQNFQEPDSGFLFSPDDTLLPPTENTTGDNIAFIRHLEFKTSSGMYMAYNAGDLDSSMMRRFAAIIATSSEYQQYGWDLINQRQFEIRPAVGTQNFNPRYFYINKPRRLAFDNSPLPFQTVPSTKYLRTQALSDLFLSVHEYEASAQWEEKADKELIRAVRAASQINSNRNVYVTPYMM